MTLGWTKVIRAAKPKKAAPKKVPFGSSFNVGTIVAGLDAWGTECKVKAVKVLKVTAPLEKETVSAVHSFAKVAKATAPVLARKTTPVFGNKKTAAAASIKNGAQKAMKIAKRAAAKRSNLPEVVRKAAKAARIVVPFGATLAGKSGTSTASAVEPKVEAVASTANTTAAAPAPPAGVLAFKKADIRSYLASNSYVAAHCTSRDWDEPKRSSAGVAPVILQSTGFSKPARSDCLNGFVTRQADGARVLYTLLTKDDYWCKPTYHDFTKCLEHLATAMVEAGQFELIIPFIGCGRDQLPLSFVILSVREQLCARGINVLMVSNSEVDVAEAKASQRSQAHPKSENKWTNTLRNGLRDFVDRPKEVYEPERKLAKRLFTNERVLAEYTCSCEGNGSLTLNVADIRHAVRHPTTPIAVATSRDWQGANRGKFAPASYLYEECNYAKPSQDDLINSRVTFQRIGDKPVFTLLVKDKESNFPKLADYRRALLELALGLEVIGEKSITIPALCMDRDRMQYEAGLNSILELVCARGINVRLCTTSKSQFFTLKSILQKHGKDADVWTTDSSTPKNWVPKPEDQHNHKCYSCGSVYSHWHRHHNKDHPQFDKQCPNRECVEYHHGKNPTNSQMVSQQPDDFSLEKNFRMLADPEWVREASVFPAAIETVWESVSNYFPNMAEGLMPTNIADNTKEEVIQLRRLGYAGAVDSKPAPVKVWQFSQSIGLAEVRPRPTPIKRENTPRRPTAHELKDFSTKEQRPIKPGFFRSLSIEESKAYLVISGCTSHYENTYYRTGTSRRQNKRLAGLASAFLRTRDLPEYYNRFSSIFLEEEEFSSAVVPSAVDEPLTASSSSGKVFKRVSRSKASAKRSDTALDDDYWMAYFKSLDSKSLPKVTLARAKRDARATKVRVAHLIKPSPKNSGLDLVGDITNFADVTTDLAIFDLKTRQPVYRHISDVEHNIEVSCKTKDSHCHAIVRTFECDTNLCSGSPIYNGSGQVCSLITMSNRKGRYAVISNTTELVWTKCSDEKCRFCELELGLQCHKPKGKKKKQSNNMTGKSNKTPTQAQVVKLATDMANLKLSAEKQKQDIATLSTSISSIRRDNVEISKAATSLAKSSSVVIATTKAPTKKRKPQRASYNVTSNSGSITQAVRNTFGMVLVLFSIIGLSAASCFSGYVGVRYISGNVSCFDNTLPSGFNYLHQSILSHPLNVITSDDVRIRSWYSVQNELVEDLAPCHVLVDKQDNLFAINDFVSRYSTTSSYDSWWPMATLVMLVFSVLTYVCVSTCSRRQNNKPVRVVKGPIYNQLTTAVLLMAMVTVIAAGPTNNRDSNTVAKTSGFVTELSNEQKLVEAKKAFDELANWFNDHKASAKNMKEQVDQLSKVQSLLSQWGGSSDPTLVKANLLVNDWNDKVKRLEGHIANVNKLTSDINSLKARIDELEKSQHNAKHAFEEFRTRFARSAELEEYGDVEDMDEDELIATETNLTSRRDDLMDAIETYETDNASQREPRQFSSISRPRDDKSASASGNNSDEPESVDLIPNSPSIMQATQSGRPQDPIVSVNNAGSDSSVFCWRTDSDPTTAVIESDIKVKFGVNGDVACDSSGFQWCLYKNWKTCESHGDQKSAIGLGWDECAIGRFTFNDHYYVARKNNGDSATRQLCSASCFSINDIVMAMKSNFGNAYCTWPLILSNHWDVSEVIGNATTLVKKYVSVAILSDKLVLINSDGNINLPKVGNEAITVCCSGSLSKELGHKFSYYEGPCLCVANAKAIEKRIKDALVDQYGKAYSKWHHLYSLKTMGSVAIVLFTSMLNPFLGLATGVLVFATNVYADCSLKNYHTLYVGDSNSKQIYTSLYMEKGDCFTLGETTYELMSVDDQYSYKQTEEYPSSFTTLCTDIDWGCGLSEGSKVCQDFTKTCKDKCDKTAGAIYRSHCLATTTFHNDGCYGFLVQDHSVSVHGGVCLLTNASKPFIGYSKFEKSESRKLTFKMSSFDQSSTFDVNLSEMIYNGPSFTIQDIKIQRDRIPLHMLDAGQLLCAYADISGNDFCHTVTTDTSKLSNQGCVNLDWTFLADDQKWLIEDTSAIITPYVYNLFEVCEFDNVTKANNVIDVTPSGLLVAFKIDSDYKCTAFQTTRCKSVTVTAVDSTPGFIDMVQATWVKVSVKSDKECYVSLRLDSCSFISHNYCKVTTNVEVCRWIVYCAAVMDVGATLVGNDDLESFNFTSGKQSFPTLEYSRTIVDSSTASTASVLSTIASGATKVLSYIPGYDFISRILSFSLEKFMVPLILLIAFVLCCDIHWWEGAAAVAVATWVYLFTSFVHADDGSIADLNDIKVWHLLLIIAVGSIDWCKLLLIVYVFICRRASGLWHTYNLNNLVIGVPFIDWVLWISLLCSVPLLRLSVLCCTILAPAGDYLWRMSRFPQSTAFNMEVLKHSPIASFICRYVSRASGSVPNNSRTISSDIWYNTTSAVLVGNKTSFTAEIGMRMFNSPPPDGVDEDDTVEYLEVSKENEQDEYDLIDNVELRWPSDLSCDSDSEEEFLDAVTDDYPLLPSLKEEIHRDIVTGKGSPHVGKIIDERIAAGTVGVVEHEGVKALASFSPTGHYIGTGKLSEDDINFLEAQRDPATDNGTDEQQAIMRPNRLSDNDYVVSEALPVTGQQCAKKKNRRSPEKEAERRRRKREQAHAAASLKPSITIVLHRLVWKHAHFLIEELNRVGRVASFGVNPGKDTHVVCERVDEPEGDIIKVTVKFNAAHHSLMSADTYGLQQENKEINAYCGKGATTIECKNTQMESVLVPVITSIVPEYEFKHFGASATRYYIHVPHCGGFELLKPEDLPLFHIVPEDAKTADEKINAVLGVLPTVILVVNSRNNVPRNWIRVATTLIYDLSLIRKWVIKTEKMVDQDRVFKSVKNLRQEKETIAVANLPSLVNAVFVIGNKCRKRNESLLTISKPNMYTVREMLDSTDSVSIDATYFAGKAISGDYIKFTLNDYMISIFRSKLEDFLATEDRTFLCFCHRERKQKIDVSNEYGQLKPLWNVVSKAQIRPDEFCVRASFGNSDSSIYVAIVKDSIFDGFSFELLEKSMKQCSLNVEADKIEHIYIVLPDGKGRKYINYIANAIIDELTVNKVEVTILLGENNDMQGVVRHAYTAMRVLSNGEPIEVDTSVNVTQESRRKDHVSKKEAAIAKGLGLDGTSSTKFSFRLQENNETHTIMYRRGEIVGEDWTIIEQEVEFDAYCQGVYGSSPFKEDLHRQVWMYDVAKGAIVGLLPSEGLRPKHFGIFFKDSRYYGEDVVGMGPGGSIFAPLCGSKDKGKRATYKTLPIVQHGGGTATGLYTTELEKHIGKPYVFSKNRLLSGCQVYVVSNEYERERRECLHSLSSGFITSCSRAKLLGVDGYIHPLVDFVGLMRTRDLPDHLNPRSRVALNKGNVRECFTVTFNPSNIDLSFIGTIPSCADADVMSSAIELSTEDKTLDPVANANDLQLAEEHDRVDEKDWWANWSDYCFIEAWSDSSYTSTVPLKNSTLCPPISFGPHPICPEYKYCSANFPSDLSKIQCEGALRWFKRLEHPSIFCSGACAYHYNIAMCFRANYKFSDCLSAMFHSEIDINRLSEFPIFRPSITMVTHACLPELPRLQHAMKSANWNRVKWYDNILDSGDAEDVFLGFQVANRTRLVRFNNEVDAVCSPTFDYPTSFNGTLWTMPSVVHRTLLTAGYKRTSSIGVYVTDTDEDPWSSKPLLVKVKWDKFRIPNTRTYVEIRRACTLLLAQGWNYFDVFVDTNLGWNYSKLASALVFDIRIYGTHCINVVTTNQAMVQAFAHAPQLLENRCLAPTELALGAPFLWKRGVKTAAIVESLNSWFGCRPVSWESIDVKKSGLSLVDCPEVTITSDNRPTFMGDNSFSIWTITNGIKTGTCYASGMDVVGANHCTLGNTICLETPAPNGNSLGVKRATYVNKVVKSFEAGDLDLHNGEFTFAQARKGEIYATLNPAQKRGRWLMCTSVAEYDDAMQSTYNKFVPVNVRFSDKTVEVAPYKLYKGLSGAPIISSRGAIVGIYGLSTNVHYQDTSLTGVGRDTTLCHSMVADNTSESEGYFIQAARELCEMDASKERKSYLEAPTGTGKSTLFPLAVLNHVANKSKVTTYSICLLEPTRAAVHNCFERLLTLLNKQSDRWNRLFTLRLATGKRGQLEGEHHKIVGNGKIQLCVMTYGRFIAEYQSKSEVPHNHNMLLMDEIHTRSKDVDVATAYLISGDTRTGDVKVCYMTATSVGRVCEVRLCEGKDLQGTRYRITDEYLIETRQPVKGKEAPAIITDSSYFTVDLVAARLNLRTKAKYVSWPRSAMNGGRCLVFLPSRNDCEKFVSWCRKTYQAEKDCFVSLHAGSSVKDLSSLPATAIIGCTDFASTAITVPNCRCVVDFMEDWTPMITLFANEEGYNYRNVITKEVVSSQVSTQRKGRTGRTCNGTYYSCSSIHTVEETKLSESMHAQIYFNLLIKMGNPGALRGFTSNNPEFERIFEHDWLEPDNLANRYIAKRDTFTKDPHKTAYNRFTVKMAAKLEIVKEWDKDQLWWYLSTCVGQDYLDFCFSTENIKTHGFGTSNVKVTKQVNENWLVVPTEEEARKVREDLLFRVDSYAEDMSNFDNYAQRAHDVVGSVSLHTLAKRVEKIAPAMLKTIDPTILKVQSDAQENLVSEATEEVVNEESAIGVAFGAVAAAGALGALCSAGLFAFNHRADWTAVEVHSVPKSDLASATYTSMVDYCNNIAMGTPLDKDPTINALTEIMEWLERKWHSMSAFFKNLFKGIISFRDIPDNNQESSGSEEILAQILKHLMGCKVWLIAHWYKYGAINVSSTIASFGLGFIYNRMCDAFGVVFTNAIIAVIMAASSIYLGSTQTAINAVVLILSYITTGCMSSRPNIYGSSNSLRATALLVTAGGGAALSLLLKGSFLSKPIIMASGPNVSTGLLGMINPYNTGVSKVSDGIIIAKMVASLCKKSRWGSTDVVAVASTLMSMLFRADAMTCMVSLTSGLFLGFARVYMSNTEFWFKMASAANIKNADSYRDIMLDQIDRFDKIFDTILFSAGILANPMSLVSIVCNIIADVTVAHMRADGSEVEYWEICKEAAIYHSGVSMIYGMACAVFKICHQLKETVSLNFSHESSLDVTNILLRLKEMCCSFSFEDLWSKTTEITKENFSNISFDLFSLESIKSLLSGIWEMLQAFFKCCYDWCKEKVNVFFARTKHDFTNAVKAAMPFSKLPESKGRTSMRLDSQPSIQDAFWGRAAHGFKQQWATMLSIDSIVDNMKNRTGCTPGTEFEGLVEQHRCMCGLIGWAMMKYSIDPLHMYKHIGIVFGMNNPSSYGESVYFHFSVKLLNYLEDITKLKCMDIVQESEGRFSMVGGSNSVSGVFDLYKDVPTNTSGEPAIHTVAGDSKPQSIASDIEPVPYLDLDYIVNQLQSTPFDYTWLEDLRLLPVKEVDYDNYLAVDQRFWIKERLQDTGDRNIIPLFIQSAPKCDIKFGPIPNTICDLGSEIYVTEDKSIGSGDYIFGELKRPWDVMRLDSTSLSKLLSLVGDVSDMGTHVTMNIGMSDKSVIQMSIAHSYTDKVANTGLLCQLQDTATKQVVKDLAAVEIMSWSTPEGFKMIATCPVSTAGAWDLLYNNILKYLPFFRDVVTHKIPTIKEAKTMFLSWADMAAPVESSDAYSEFLSWKTNFLERRFTAKSYFGMAVSSTMRGISNLASAYNKNLAETREINATFEDPANYFLMREKIGYSSYYNDFAQAIHSRTGFVSCDPTRLPFGIEDVRINLGNYALGCWFRKLTCASDVMNIDCTKFRVTGKRTNPMHNLHHPSAFFPNPELTQKVNLKYTSDAKASLVRFAYICGHNVVFANVSGNEVDYEMSGAAGTCRCTVVYVIDGFNLISAASYRCIDERCLNTVDDFYIYNEDADTIISTNSKINTESDTWLPVVGLDSVMDLFNIAKTTAMQFLKSIDAADKATRAIDFVKQAEEEFTRSEPIANVVPLVIPDRDFMSMGDDDAKNKFGETVAQYKLRSRRTKANKDKPSDLEHDRVNDFWMSPGTRRMFSKKKDLGEAFFDWLRECAVDEKRRKIVPPSPGENIITSERATYLREKYSLLTVDELIWLKMMGEEVEDVDAYLRLTHKQEICSEAPWCDGWDKLAVHSRPRDFWLTDGNMDKYYPHQVDDANVVRDIVRVNKMIDHCPKKVWEECRYKNRMQLPNRESDIGSVYASRAACKAQLLYDYMPGFWNNHKVFFEPCCGFGGFAQFFSHQMRNMEPRQYYVSSMNKSGHAQPNWTLMQAADSNCRVIRVLQDVRDGNICDPAVLAGCRDVIKQSGVTMLIFDIGERHTDPNVDDAWYLVPRNVKGGFDVSETGWKHGHSICTAIASMVEVLPNGADALFKVNTFSMRVADIIHTLSKSFNKVRALKLATTPEMSREFYLFCSQKKTGWEAPIHRTLLLKDCIKELTWNAMFRAENLYRTKGRHALPPKTYKWFTPDTSGISYKMLPNLPGDRDELDVTDLPNGHAIHIATTTPRGAVKVDLEFEPNWDSRFKCMKDYVRKVNKVSKSRTNRGRDNIKFDNAVRSDFTFVKGIGSFSVKQKNTAEKHTANDLIASYLSHVGGLNISNATYGHTQGTAEFVKPALKRRLDVQPGQPDPTCVIDFAKAVHCLMSEAAVGMLGRFKFMTKDETFAMIVKTGSTGILDPGSNLREFMEIYPEWYELAWEHILNPHTLGKATPSYQSVRIKPEPKGRKDVEDGRLQIKKGATLDEVRAGNSLSPRFIQFSDALTRIAHIIAFGNVLEYHGKKKLYKGSINGTPPHIQGRVMRAYWDLHNPIKKRVIHVGNNKELDISVDPVPGYLYKTQNSDIKALDIEGRLGSDIYDHLKDASRYQDDLPAGLTIDFSALDSTVTVSERMIMTDLWKRFFDNSDEKKIIEGLCRDMTYAICLNDTGDIWVRDGQRGSGEILTSIENTWLVTANIVCSISHALGISIEDLTATQGHVNVLTRPGGCGSDKVDVRSEISKGAHHKRFEFGDIPLLVDGDDVVIISTRRKIDQIQTYLNGNYQWLACNRKVIRSGNKGGATKYLEFEGLSFCSHRYEAVFIGPNASKFNPKFLPRSEGGRKLTRGDLLSVAEDNDFKIYFLPIRPVADILSKLMLTLKVKSLKWDATKTGAGECVDLTQSKIISYLLLYPQCRWVRYTCLTLLCVTGDTLATFTELKKRYRDLSEMELKHTSKLLSSMSSLYGVSSLDDISLREYRSDTAEIRKLYHNTRLTFNVTQVTKAAWLNYSFDWLSTQKPADVYPLMWDSSVFRSYQQYCEHTVDDNVSHLRELLKLAGFRRPCRIENNKDTLWGRILTLVG